MCYSVYGKTAIVTGAGSGINFSFAALLFSKGCNVLIADLQLRPEAEALVQASGCSRPPSPPASIASSASSSPAPSTFFPRMHFLKTDVTSWFDLSRMFSHAVSLFSTIDIVCPGAGIYEPPSSNFWFPPSLDQESPSCDDPLADHYKTLEVNVTHPIRVTQLAIGHFLKHGIKDGRVVLVSSQSGSGEVGITTPLYYASKHAIHGFVKSMGRLEKEVGIKINAVAPGIVRTPLWLDAPEKLSTFSPSHDIWVTPESVAAAMFDLLTSPEHPGGTILEIGSECRHVQPLNDPGPQGAGFELSNMQVATDGIFTRLRKGAYVHDMEFDAATMQ
ncbi:nad-dependent 15-hydroxyprostaglandin dehydrogenase [Phlyctema vagabunda]|uniref:Nad-dependent 15-hydroxyprostaglandin dehydrogenase n=1 Tax=Phlyctema vagabunda TaxID=108571 RepID=A0ABR4PGA7_9HELO